MSGKLTLATTVNMSSFPGQKIPSNVGVLVFPYFRFLVWLTSLQDINSELDELDREEFYRLKKVSNKKQRDNEAANAEILALRQKEAEMQQITTVEPELPVAPDVLGEREDEDIIF